MLIACVREKDRHPMRRERRGPSRLRKNAGTSSFRGAGSAREPGIQEHGPEKSIAWPVFMGSGPGPDGPSRKDTRVFQHPASAQIHTDHSPGCAGSRLPGEGGCNPIGFNEHGHDSAITFSCHPGAGRDPCFHKHLSLIASATVSHRTAPRRLHYGSRPAPGWRNL